jgi:hypothetical protein
VKSGVDCPTIDLNQKYNAKNSTKSKKNKIDWVLYILNKAEK